MSDSKRDFRTYFNGKLPLDWKPRPAGVLVDAEWGTPVWHVLASQGSDHLIVSFSRRDSKYPSKDEFARFAARLSDDWQWEQIEDTAIQVKRDGKWSQPNMKFLGTKKK